MGTAAGGLYSGVESAYPVCSLSLDSAAERLVEAALRPYSALIRVYRGRAAFQQYAQQLQPAQPAQPAQAPNAAAPRVLVAVDVPEPLSEYQLLLLVPVLDNHNYPELVRRGHDPTRRSSLRSASRLTLRLLSAAVCSAVAGDSPAGLRL